MCVIIEKKIMIGQNICDISFRYQRNLYKMQFLDIESQEHSESYSVQTNDEITHYK